MALVACVLFLYVRIADLRDGLYIFLISPNSLNASVSSWSKLLWVKPYINIAE